MKAMNVENATASVPPNFLLFTKVPEFQMNICNFLQELWDNSKFST
jgi:hypothetical protein